MKGEMLMVRVGGALRPDGDAAWNVFDKIPAGKRVTVTVHQHRNPEHLRRYWALASCVADADPGFDDKDDADHWVRVSIPWMRKEYKLADGRFSVRPKSISVGSMDQQEFSQFYQRAAELWSQRIGMDVELLLKEAIERAKARRAPAI